MKKVYLIIASFIIVLTLCICLFPQVSRTYVFENSLQDIVSIELMLNSNETGEADAEKLMSQKLLTQDEIEGFMSEVYKLETRRSYPPMWGWGAYVAKVTYSNGDVELLGTSNIEYVEQGATGTGDGPYSFWKYGAFEEVFLRYLN